MTKATETMTLSKNWAVGTKGRSREFDKFWNLTHGQHTSLDLSFFCTAKLSVFVSLFGMGLTRNKTKPQIDNIVALL